MENIEEIFKAIPGYEGLYEAGNLGNIWSIRNNIFLATSVNRGYRFVNLWNSMVKKHSVHSIIMLAHVGIRPSGYDINHKDENRENNKLSNLEYVTRSQNTIHSIRKISGENNVNAKLKSEDILKIIDLDKTGEYTHEEISKINGISRSAVSLILAKKRWKMVSNLIKLN